jgi:hypothetical protein
MLVSSSAAYETLLLQLPFRDDKRGERLSLGTREQNSFTITVQPQVWVFLSRNSARTEEREGRCLRSPCRSRPCTGDRQLGFWGAFTRLLKHPSGSSSWRIHPVRHDKRSWTRIWILGAHGRVWPFHLITVLHSPDYICSICSWLLFRL